MSPGQDSVDRYLAEHETPIDRTIRLIREDERAKLLADLRAKVAALRDEAMDHDRATGDPTFAMAIIAYQTVLTLLDGSSDE